MIQGLQPDSRINLQCPMMKSYLSLSDPKRIEICKSNSLKEAASASIQASVDNLTSRYSQLLPCHYEFHTEILSRKIKIELLGKGKLKRSIKVHTWKAL